MALAKPLKVNSWQFYLGTLFFASIGSFGIYRAAEILFAGTLTYTKKGFPAKTVSPVSGAFEFYYQVLFHFTLGAFGALMAVAMFIAIYSFHTKNVLALQPHGKLVIYVALPFGMAWFALHISRYWLI